MKNVCYIDFEYRKTNEEKLDLVSVSMYWGTTFTCDLRVKENREQVVKIINGFKEHTVFAAWAVTAEASSFYSLGLNPIDFHWIDLYLEYRCLTNHNHNWMYGKQLIDGIEKVTTPPKNKWDRTEEEDNKANRSKPQHNLAAACYKVLGVKIDTDFKDHIRNIIIHGSDWDIEENIEEILRYNESDIKYLRYLYGGIVNEYRRLLKDDVGDLRSEMLERGDYAARTAVMERIGYPIDYDATLHFSKSVNDIMWSLQNEINELFPDILPFTKKRNRDYSWSNVRTRQWIETLPEAYKKKWKKTEKGQYSLSFDAFKEHFNFRHDYPKDNFGAQMVRYLNTKRNLNGFIQSKTAKKRNNFFDYVGSDHRVRPYFGIYGSQSARSQPKATSFLFLKSAWMRALAVPPKGKALAAIDYKSQEFLLAGLLSKDANMIQAYMSGDVYLYLAKKAGAVPWSGTKQEYPEERDIFKVVTLALQYGMGKTALAKELTNKLGKEVSEDEAEDLIGLFNKAYRDHYRWKSKLPIRYEREGHLKLPCGWYMWGDNDNSRSVGNFPVQGMGSSIMRKAVTLAQDAGLTVIFTLHDAIYIEYDIGCEKDIQTLGRCMKEAFSFYFEGGIKERANVGLDANCWSPEYEDGYFNIEEIGTVKRQSIYVDERSKVEYDRFKEYFKEQVFDL